MTLINLATHTAAICNTTYNSIKSVLIVNFTNLYPYLLNIHDLFSVSIVNFAVSVVNFLISLCDKIS